MTYSNYNSPLYHVRILISPSLLTPLSCFTPGITVLIDEQQPKEFLDWYNDPAQQSDLFLNGLIIGKTVMHDIGVTVAFMSGESNTEPRTSLIQNVLINECGFPN